MGEVPLHLVAQVLEAFVGGLTVEDGGDVLTEGGCGLGGAFFARGGGSGRGHDFIW